MCGYAARGISRKQIKEESIVRAIAIAVKIWKWHGFDARELEISDIINSCRRHITNEVVVLKFGYSDSTLIVLYFYDQEPKKGQRLMFFILFKNREDKIFSFGYSFNYSLHIILRGKQGVTIKCRPVFRSDLDASCMTIIAAPFWMALADTALEKWHCWGRWSTSRPPRKKYPAQVFRRQCKCKNVLQFLCSKIAMLSASNSFAECV